MRKANTRKRGRSNPLGLSFVSDEKSERCFWNVKPSGDYGEDGRVGQRLAVEFIDWQAEQKDSPALLPHIVGDMPRKLTGLEIGFLTIVCFAAEAGKHEAHRLHTFWGGDIG